MTHEPANDTGPRMGDFTARLNLQRERMKHDRAERIAKGLEMYAIDLGREAELRAEIDKAWALVGLAAVDLKVAELELAKAVRGAR